MLNLNSIMLGSENSKKLAEFYEKVIGKPADMHEGDWYGWVVGNCFLSMGMHSEVKGMSKEPPRMMFTFETTDIEGEFARIKELGATVIAELYKMGDATIPTFADPDGNYFQLMPPWEG